MRFATGSPLEAVIADWVSRQRWYVSAAGTRGRPALSCQLLADLLEGRSPERARDPTSSEDSVDSPVDIQTWIVTDTSAETPVTYHVPLTYRRAPLSGAEAGLIGTVTGSETDSKTHGYSGEYHGYSSEYYVYDAPHDLAYVAQLLDLIRQSSTSGMRHRVLDGEQSNTSVIITLTEPLTGPSPVNCSLSPGHSPEHPPEAPPDEPPITEVIIKVFRILQHGDNPDVVVQAALASTGCSLIPRPVGQLTRSWPDQLAPDGVAHGHLAVGQEFIPNAQDAWREAITAAATGHDFTHRARTLGAAIAQLHLELAQTLPTEPFTDRHLNDLADALTTRLDWAVRQVPALAPRAPGMRSVLQAVRAINLTQRANDETATDPTRPSQLLLLQRIHGDLHLGQVLHHSRRGWIILDFEGEPLRPLDQRNQPDLALRDVAGMLRSFDYAGNHHRLLTPHRVHPVSSPMDGSTTTDTADHDSAQSHRDAFCHGYSEVAGYDPRSHAVLLRALELEKAAYEAAYEAGNRPDWLPIPLAAIDHLLAKGDDV